MTDTLTITVDSVRGRYPHSRTSFKPESIEAFAIPSGEQEYLIRLDSKDHPDFWLEVRLTVKEKP